MSEGEFEIIDKYFANIGWRSDEVQLGPGDDCALLKVSQGNQLCVSTDTLLSGVHLPVGAAGDVAAHRALAANLSDLSAMGARPLGFLIALTLPEADNQWLELFSKTISTLSHQYRIPLVGGNLSRGPLSVTMTIMGTVPEGSALTRSGAQVGDAVYTTGYTGDAAAGLRVVTQGCEGHEQLARAYCHPLPAIETGQALRGIASACIDISDGLLPDLDHILQASGVGAIIELDRLSISSALRAFANTGDLLEFVLAGGDDYQLCFSAPPDRQTAILDLSRRTGTLVTRIGSIVADKGLWMLHPDGHKTPVESRGYRHF